MVFVPITRSLGLPEKMRRSEIENLLKRAMIIEEDDAGQQGDDATGSEGLKPDEGDSNAYISVPLLPPIPVNRKKTQKKHFSTLQSNRIPETSDRNIIGGSGTQRYALGPWERPASRGSIEQTLKNTARARRISKGSMMYSKRSEQLGYENAHRGRPHLAMIM